MGRPANGPSHASQSGVSPLTVNRLSIYLRCLEDLAAQGIERISSTELAQRYHLSASQIRKDLAQFGEFGIRGVGYLVDQLTERLRHELGIDRRRGVVVLGIGNLGSALARSAGFDSRGFAIVGLFDHDPQKVGTRVGQHQIRSPDELPQVVSAERAEIGVLAVPSEAAQAGHDRLVAAGVAAILNFAPAQLRQEPGVRVKTVDFRIFLEELAFYL